MVPEWYDREFWHLVKDMTLVRYYPVGKVLFSKPTPDGKRKVMPPIRWPVCVFWDPPVPERTTHNNIGAGESDGESDLTLHSDDPDDENPTARGMSLTGIVHGVECHEFLDSGGEGTMGNFMSREFAEKLGLRINASDSKVSFGDGRKTSLVGNVSARLSLPALHGTLRQRLEFTVIKLAP